MSEQAVIVSACRTAIGTFLGGLSSMTAPRLGAAVIKGAVERAGAASGINNAVSRVAGLLAIAVMTVILSLAFNAALDGRIELLNLAPGVEAALEEARTKLAGAEAPAGVGSVVAAAIERAIDESYVSSFRIAMYVAAGLALASALAHQAGHYADADIVIFSGKFLI